jgi:hypothetical protein
MQVVNDRSSLVNNFIKNVWGEENFTPAIVSSTGFVLATKSVAGALSSVGSSYSVCYLTCSDLHEIASARRGFRETMLASFAVTAWNLSEVVIYTIAGLVALVAFQDKKILSLAAKSVVQFIANSFYGALGIIGQFSPTLAVKIYAVGLRCLFIVQPDILQICKKEFFKDSETLSEGLIKALGKNPDIFEERELEQIDTVLADAAANIEGVEAQLVVSVSEVVDAIDNRSRE